MSFLNRNLLTRFWFIFPFLTSGCTTATLGLKDLSIRDGFNLEKLKFVDCKKLNGKIENSCSSTLIENLHKCEIYRQSNRSDLGLLNVKMIVEVNGTGNGVGWTPLSVFTIGIIPTYSTVAVERIRVVSVVNGKEIASWENLIQIQGGWYNIFTSAINRIDPNDYCDQFKRVISEKKVTSMVDFRMNKNYVSKR